MSEWKDQNKIADKSDKTTWRDKSKGIIQIGETEKIPGQSQAIQTKTFENNERIFYQQVGGECSKTYQEPGAKEAKQFWSKIWGQKEHNRKANWINNMKKELQGIEEIPEAENYLKLLRATEQHFTLDTYLILLSVKQGGIKYHF